MFTYVAPGLLKVWRALLEECSRDNQWQKLPYRCPHHAPSTRRIATPMRPGNKQKTHGSSQFLRYQAIRDSSLHWGLSHVSFLGCGQPKTGLTLHETFIGVLGCKSHFFLTIMSTRK